MIHSEPKAEVMVVYPYPQAEPPIRSTSALEWSEVVRLLTNPAGTSWLSTVSGEGQVHTTPVGAFFVSGTYYFSMGQGTRKRANLEQNQSCTISIHAGSYDIVAEGTASMTRDNGTIEQLAAFCRSVGWPVEASEASGGTLDAPYHAPTTGPAPYDVFEMTLRKVFVLGITDEGISHCTRYIF
ncbi:MAG: pyridoxamine 5'-phosphate oxidase family protein [Chloroflexota bacterium]|nr:pyridoxamine 5'-phosphate oxidase family protein [Chloroflexota bacterium]